MCSGYESTMRAPPLAQKIVASDIALGLNSSFAFYAPDNCACPRAWSRLWRRPVIGA